MSMYAGGQPAADNTTVEYDAQGKLRIKDGGVNAAKHESGMITNLGAKILRNENTTYQAATDGIVVAICDPGSGDGLLIGRSDASATPTTVLQRASSTGISPTNNKISICFPVLKDDYYVVEDDDPTTTIYFIPLS